MNAYVVMNQVASLFFILGIGYFSYKKQILNSKTLDDLSSLLLKIALPFLIISSFNLEFSEELKTNMILSFYYSIISFVALKIFCFLFFYKIEPKKKLILNFSTLFANCGFMGFPIIYSVFGKEGVLYASILNMVFGLLMWTYGWMLFSEDKSFSGIKKALINPGVSSVYIGSFLLLFKIKLPNVIQYTLENVGSMTTPLSMIIIGGMLAQTEMKNFWRDKNLIFGVICKLLIAPIITWASFLFLNIDKSIVTDSIILLQAMPTAVVMGIFAENYKKSQKDAALMIFLTTLGSIATIPIFIIILK